MRFTIPLPPAHFQRPRPGRNGKYYSPHSNDVEEWRALFRNQMRLQGAAILEGPVAVHQIIGADKTRIEVIPVVGAEPTRPKGVRPDLDNIVKFNHDALEKVVYFNDSQIVDLAATFA